jgi:hypothetical protein
MSTVNPSLAGPKRPQDKISLQNIGDNFSESFDVSTDKKYKINIDKNTETISNSSVVIPTITYGLDVLVQLVIAAITTEELEIVSVFLSIFILYFLSVDTSKDSEKLSPIFCREILS